MNSRTLLFVSLTALLLSGCTGEPTAALEIPSGQASVDQDSDGVPDSAEAELCGRNVIKGALSMSGLGDCDGSDWQPNELSHRAFVPTMARAGDDLDGDGLPGYVFLDGVHVTVDVFSSDRVTMEQSLTSIKVALDLDDADPEFPVISTVHVPVSMPVGAGLGNDRDRDDLPSTIDLWTAQLTFDRRDQTVELVAQDRIQVPLDEADDDPMEPVMDRITADVITNAWQTGDGDDDGLPHSVFLRYTTITVDRSLDTLTVTFGQQDQEIVVDENDEDRNSVVPFSMVDNDGDLIPDATEPIICDVQRNGDPADGVCVLADGSGEDGDGTNYIPPAIADILNLLDTILRDPTQHGIELDNVDGRESAQEAPGAGIAIIGLALLGLAGMRRL